MTVVKTVRRGSKVWVIDQSVGGNFNLLELPGDYDFSKGLPTGGEWFDTLRGAEEALQQKTRNLEDGTL